MPPQATPPPQTTPADPAPQTQNRGENSDRRITVTGCLQAVPPGATGATSPTGTSGTADAKGDPATGDAKFLLTNVTPADSAGGANAAAAAAPRTYRLIANEAALSPHLGKKLELTGTLDDQSSSTSSPSSASSDASAASAGSAPKLKVESGKVIAAQCSQ
jgi:hypothetical protein